MSDTNDTFKITPEDWAMRPLQSTDRYGLGIWLADGKLVGTDGHMLVARDKPNTPALPETWRLEFHHPAKLLRGETIEIPRAIGAHAIERENGKIALVKVYDCGETPPDWRALRTSWESPRGQQIGLNPRLVSQFAAMTCGERGPLVIHPAADSPLSPVTYTANGVFGLIMPQRID
jgi:hypothetical protein